MVNGIAALVRVYRRCLGRRVDTSHVTHLDNSPGATGSPQGQPASAAQFGIPADNVMNQPAYNLILASRSPRRRDLLRGAGYQFQIIEPDEAAEQGIDPRESPRETVSRLAQQKAADVARQVKRAIVLGCDTLVECHGHILGKPENIQHARSMLRRLRGRVHHVYSGLCLWRRPDDVTRTAVDVTKLRMDFRTDNELEEYLDTGAWEGKAGAFGFQDRLGWIHIICGSESNVVGLPMELLANMLRQFKED
jgi:septum formation protein